MRGLTEKAQLTFCFVNSGNGNVNAKQAGLNIFLRVGRHPLCMQNFSQQKLHPNNTYMKILCSKAIYPISLVSSVEQNPFPTSN